MAVLAVLPVAVPLGVALLLTGASHLLKGRWPDFLALAGATAALVLCLLLLQGSLGGVIVHWFGGWQPRREVALGISFVIGPLGAGMATLASLLTTVALLFSWRYFKSVGTLYHVLVLVFLAAMNGFALTGDLFNLFVFFELMSVAAYALTAYKAEEQSPLEAGLIFAVTNSIGAFLVLLGIALVYGRTGALNLAQAGEALAKGPLDGLVVTALTLIICGFLVKGASAPFHYWLSDAHAVAPTPVCVLFSGVMVSFGLFGAARVYWTLFSGVIGGHEDTLRALLLAFGVATTLVGAVMCFLQRHLKRLLAFSTISHVGMLLVGIALLENGALAGSALYVVGHGLVKAALFLVAGILLHRHKSVDEIELRGKGRGLPIPAAVFLVGGLALAGLPPFGTALGKSLIEHSASELGFHWVPWLFLLASGLTGGAVLRAFGRIFLGLGAVADAPPGPTESERRETRTGLDRVPFVMLAPPLLLLVLALAAGLDTDLAKVAHSGAASFTDRSGYVATVLNGRHLPLPEPHGPTTIDPTGAAFAAGAVILSLLLAWLALTRLRLTSLLRPVSAPLLAVHSGRIGDYVTWMMAGVAVFGTVLAVFR